MAAGKPAGEHWPLKVPIQSVSLAFCGCSSNRQMDSSSKVDEPFPTPPPYFLPGKIWPTCKNPGLSLEKRWMDQSGLLFLKRAMDKK